ncbi:DHA1 family multidrug resistance protein B-like MFS transporter [Bacillus sp. SORGH_AS 510]|uniref:MDR family MFS transporter n=1 Tax=Bacillus sp. SORGH_AS_0510 TaxID=3041771 RepID=UPI00278477D0|nr:MFS transporter [Bacillus sp. SORGH_AS_0510]MDQ1143977.1 DHA1 family multidrug resistance protein B-like MFS transporter [Bacillus sp. SORGH_AS_0510]
MFRTLHPNIKIRIYTSFLSRVVGSAIFPFMAIYFTKEINVSTAGILVLIQVCVQFIAGLYGGYLADIIGRKRLMVAGEVMKVGAFACMLAVNSPIFVSPWITFIMMLLIGVSSGIVNPAAEAMLIDVSTKETRAFMYSVNYWAVNLSIMIGLMIGGWFFEHYFFELLGVLTFMSLVTLWITAAFIIDTYQVKKGAGDKTYGLKPMVKSYGLVIKDWAFMAFTLGGIAILSIEFQRNNFISVRLEKEIIPQTIHLFNSFAFDLDGIKLLSLLTVVNTMMVVLFTAVTAKWIKGKKEEPIMYVGFILFGLGYFFLAFSNSIPMLFISVVVLTIGELLYVPTRQSLLADIVDDSKRGTYMAMNGLVFQVGKMIGALGLIIGNIIGGIAMGAGFLALVVLSIVFSRLALRPTEVEFRDSPPAL